MFMSVANPRGGASRFSQRHRQMSMYHRGNREIQSMFGSVALADRLVEKTHRTAFTAADKEFIESCAFFFLATADEDAHPDCSFKGGAPGFVRVVAPDLLVYPDYDGNGMFKSLGNIRSNPHVGLLFIGVGEKPKRLRVNGDAQLSFDDPLLANFPGGQLLVRITPTHIFPNCPRYIPKMQIIEPSPYVPQPGCHPVEPAWKGFSDFSDVVPERKSTP
jgi:predicted pyridoxine 5'-phosphate oxidase superfamily flavin-nucleotide-binding protein